jgi:predicted RNase H-like HicB family nuclease
MTTEWTVIVEPRDGGRFVARIAEIPVVRAEAKTAKEARAKAAERLREHLERKRAESLRRAGPAAAVSRLRAAKKRPAGGKRPKRRPRAETELLQGLLEQGRIDYIPTEEEVERMAREFQPIRVEGRPLSEEIIADRR